MAARSAASGYTDGMRFFVKAIATGFAMSMGSALFKKISKKVGLENEESKQDTEVIHSDAASNAAPEDEAE